MAKAIKITVWILIIFGGLFISMYLDKYVFDLEFEKPKWVYYSLNIPGLLLLLLLFNMINKIGLFISKHGKNDKIAQFKIDILIKDGLYANMRHPIYQCLLFVPFAISLMSTSPSFIFIIAPIDVLIILLLIKYVVEPEARKKFGQEYDDYKKDLPWFCFKQSCLKMFKEVFMTKLRISDLENFE